ncbi:MAG: phospholipase effector Tle1 domain-containing protein, partial [Nitrospiraceae bacterium]
MPKRIIVCFDGTWNTAEAKAPTNARRLYELIRPRDDAGTLQRKW